MPDQISNQVSLRRATVKDCRRVWEWRNERATREASFNTDCIPYGEHERWFSRKLIESQTCIFIALNAEGHELGYVRFEVTEGQAEISISIDKNERGKGYGTAVIKEGSDQLLATEPVGRIVAHMRCDNPGSIAAFERAGFVLRGYKEIAGVEACEMVYEGKTDTGAQSNRAKLPG